MTIGVATLGFVLSGDGHPVGGLRFASVVPYGVLRLVFALFGVLCSVETIGIATLGVGFANVALYAVPRLLFASFGMKGRHCDSRHRDAGVALPESMLVLTLF
jgi:hypothetical protein